MHKKTVFIITLAVFAALLIFAGDVPKQSYKPKEGYVPNTNTAIKIAVAIWEPIYGENVIADEKPYRAFLSNGVWHVSGSLPEGTGGGVANAWISKDDGKILGVGHTR